MIDLQGFGDQIAAGTVTTLRVATTSLVFGIGVGLCGAMAKLSRFQIIKRLADAYTTIIRGVPELLLILILYFGGTVAMTAIFGRYVEVDAFAAGVFSLTIVFGAYATEVFRAAIRAVPVGQIEAAQALGLSTTQTWRLVILAQMWRYALPGIGNLWLTLLKDTALISVVGLEDLMRKTGVAAGSTHDPLTFYSIAAGLYLSFTSVSLVGLTLLERRANRGVRIAE
ncbi:MULTISPECIES: ABC transporter permease [unclassified Shinella]|uniref:ABC transporter permease n=1 Tax=unclassified Shinella TaxID=2643062 RepID=UPI00225D2A00|nr:ABC transporter permease [Shinella sp. YE25]MDC7259829.1 ABC transporter permease [Shinella sp. YE25]CAI0333989.1 lysine/arginine/ornithine ABC transporter/histidine ABC transporter, membrane subunit HisQ [Rhizobiaceae bacterium]CAK7261635.1 lysine/arginine/ornithine ABC transporter/histidine ABC transporter, membrane subunit HisQ [Shinella sp. WSC3-e]